MPRLDGDPLGSGLSSPSQSPACLSGAFPALRRGPGAGAAAAPLAQLGAGVVMAQGAPAHAAGLV